MNNFLNFFLNNINILHTFHSHFFLGFFITFFPLEEESLNTYIRDLISNVFRSNPNEWRIFHHSNGMRLPFFNNQQIIYNFDIYIRKHKTLSTVPIPLNINNSSSSSSSSSNSIANNEILPINTNNSDVSSSSLPSSNNSIANNEILLINVNNSSSCSGSCSSSSSSSCSFCPCLCPCSTCSSSRSSSNNLIANNKILPININDYEVSSSSSSNSIANNEILPINTNNSSSSSSLPSSNNSIANNEILLINVNNSDVSSSSLPSSPLMNFNKLFYNRYPTPSNLFYKSQLRSFFIEDQSSFISAHRAFGYLERERLICEGIGATLTDWQCEKNKINSEIDKINSELKEESPLIRDQNAKLAYLRNSNYSEYLKKSPELRGSFEAHHRKKSKLKELNVELKELDKLIEKIEPKRNKCFSKLENGKLKLYYKINNEAEKQYNFYCKIKKFDENVINMNKDSFKNSFMYNNFYKDYPNLIKY
jgi:hypothetical protein